MPTAEKLPIYLERVVRTARAVVASPNDMEARTAYMRAVFNIDWTAAAIVALADKAGEP